VLGCSAPRGYVRTCEECGQYSEAHACLGWDGGRKQDSLARKLFPGNLSDVIFGFKQGNVVACSCRHMEASSTCTYVSVHRRLGTSRLRGLSVTECAVACKQT
jgi:hypothetical protein